MYNNIDNNGIFVVLFSCKDTGTVVYTENSLRTLGEYNTSWAMGSFKPVYGEIILKN